MAADVTVRARGVAVRFPYKPYRAQVQLINGIMDALAQGANALLESPTGTGKTLSLLCAALAWQDAQRADGEITPFGEPGAKRAAPAAGGVPRIYYCTRTHSQIAQVVHELERTSYRPTMVILASREHTCIHDKATKAVNKNKACMRLLDEKACSHYSNAKTLARSASFRPGGPREIWDIEDLVSAGRAQGACPYFAAREIAQRADLVFCPYNYVLSSSIRAALGIDLEGAVVIMDEAHNIEDVARDAGSTSIAADALRAIADDIASTLRARDSKGAFSVRCSRLSGLARRILEWIDDTAVGVEFKRAHADDHVGYAICDAAGMAHALDAWGASEAALATAADDIRALITGLTPGDDDDDDDDDEGMNFVTRETLQLLSELLAGVGYLVEGGGRFAGDFKLVLTSTRQGAAARPRGAWRGRAAGANEPLLGLEIWCLNPAVVFGRLTASARSVVLTSGTLAPLATFAAELGVAFAVQLECDHVVGPDQFIAAVLSRGAGGGELVATYRNTQSPAFLDTLGQTIAALCAVIPAGVLVFMPSYALVRAASARWRASGLLDEIGRTKRCFFEPANKQDGSFPDMLAAYYAEAPAGAVLFAVYRGKASEGINFADDNARGVLCVGVPYPSLVDVKVGAKYEFNKARALVRPDALGADAWYDTQAIRAVCQAMGRCLRHVRDRGAIVLLDARYGQARYQRLLSKWVRSALTVHADAGSLVERLRAFAAPPAAPALPATA